MLNRMENGGAVVDRESLRRAGHDLPLPFSLSPQAYDQAQAGGLFCTRLLRLVPGKRMVLKASWAGKGPVIVKLFLDAVKARRHWRRELDGVKALAQAGLATPELLFAGTLAEPGLPGLIFRELEPVATLLELWETKTAKRAFFLGRVVAEIAAQHQAGLLQKDIHWRNFLFCRDRAYSIDGDAFALEQAGRALSREESRANFALFLAEPYAGIDSYLETLWIDYCRMRGWSVLNEDLPLIRAMVARQRRSKAENFVAKSRRSCTAVSAGRQGGFFRLVERRYQSPELEKLLAAPDDFLPAGEILKAGNSSTVVRLRLDGLDLVVKRYNIKHVAHALSRCWRPSRALISWNNAQRLQWWGLAVPEPVALLEKRVCGLRSTAYFISRYVPGRDALTLLGDPQGTGSEKKAWLQAFARLFQRLLELNLSHGDCKATNFICGRDGRLYLLDLDAMRSWKRPGRKFFAAVSRDYRRLLANWRDRPELQNEFTEILAGLKRP
ncbi:MAG TPA: serine/threonine protein kinase [Proteobacteria bacterium]|nr:serine/threonine protein kinase [Pseudomonadota bacterium]